MDKLYGKTYDEWRAEKEKWEREFYKAQTKFSECSRHKLLLIYTLTNVRDYMEKMRAEKNYEVSDALRDILLMSDSDKWDSEAYGKWLKDKGYNRE